MLGATVVYVYVTANVTAIMLRFYQQLERYRSRVQRVDSYLRRNHVRSRLRKVHASTCPQTHLHLPCLPRWRIAD